jgi:hypothetical protein
VVVAFVYDYEYENGKSFLAINGQKYGQARAFAPQGITSRKIIGRHAWMQNFFHGDLGGRRRGPPNVSADINELETATSCNDASHSIFFGRCHCRLRSVGKQRPVHGRRRYIGACGA